MRVLITGVGGFAARHLAEYCVNSKKAEVHGLGRRAPRDKNIKFWHADLLDFPRVKEILRKVRPGRIFHLAAQTSVPVSWKHPEEAVETNVLGTYYLLEAVRELGLKPRIHIAGSSEEYGRIEAAKPSVSEKAVLRPVSPYGTSKVGQDVLGRFYAKAFGMHVVVTRSFSHTGPGQDERFVAGSFAKQVALAEAGLGKQVIYTGNLDNIRDFTDVRDVARAYWLALERGKPGEVYNIASSRGIPVRFIAETLVSLSRVPIRLEKDPKRFRTTDVPRIVGSASHFRKDTGWKPVVPMTQTLSDMLDEWRAKVVSKNISK